MTIMHRHEWENNNKRKKEENVSKSKKTLFKDGQCKQYIGNISSHLKWVQVPRQEIGWRKR